MGAASSVEREEGAARDARPAMDRAGGMGDIARIDIVIAVALSLLPAVLYYRTAPAVVNLDGLGYIKLLPHNFSAGHLLYMPLLRAVAALCHGDGLLAGRLVSAAAAGAALGIFYLSARALLARGPSALATAGLAFSYAVWIQGGDVEAYSCALAGATAVLGLALAYRAQPSAGRAFNLGLALAGAVLFHLTHVLLTPFVFAWCVLEGPRAKRAGAFHGMLASATGGAVTLGAYAWATFGVRHTDLAGAIKWVATAGHGFRYEGGPLARAADAIYGLAKAFVWSPYLYESDAQKLLSQFVLGLVAVVAAGALIAAGRSAAARLPWRAFAVWISAYVVMAVLFFGSDHERWLFVLVPVWLLVAAAAASLRRGSAVGVGLCVYLVIANAATAVGPAHNESWDRTRADAAAALMRDGDLVLFPGHSWDEYIGFYTRTRVVPFPLSYYAGRDGKDAMVARLDKEVRLARERGARVFAARVFDSDPDDARGWYELASLGLPPDALRRLLSDRFDPVRLATVEPKVTVWQLLPRR